MTPKEKAGLEALRPNENDPEEVRQQKERIRTKLTREILKFAEVLMDQESKRIQAEKN